MRFIHMADVHLGAVPDSGCPWSAFRENEIWETFVRVIDQIREEKIELLLIAGDLFHRQPLPSQTERVSQLFASIPDTEVVWMAGSHDYLREDSAYRKVKWTKNVHGFLSEKPEVISLEKLHTKVYGCSYEHPEVTEAIYSSIRPEDQPGIHILLAYGGDETHIPMKKEDGAGFDYVALGHIHRPQKMGRETLRYSGTPLKYSFSEADHKKSVTIVELLEKGNVRVSTVPLIPRRDMRKLRGTYMDVTAKDHYTAENKMDYLQITLTDEEDVPGALQKLRTVYPNLMRLEYDNKRTRENREVQAVEAQEQKSELELFEEFYELLNNEPMKEEQTEFVEKLIQDLKEVRV